MMYHYGMSDVSIAYVFDLQAFFFLFTSFQTSRSQAWLDSITRGRKRAAKRVLWTAMRANRRETERRGQHEDINRMFDVSFCVYFGFKRLDQRLCCHGMLAWSIFRTQLCHC